MCRGIVGGSLSFHPEAEPFYTTVLLYGLVFCVLSMSGTKKPNKTKTC